MIEIRHLSKTYGNLTVLKDVNATIQKGEIVSIIGPSGTGKSTLLRCLNLLERPSSGEILFDGVNLMEPHADISAVRMKMGMVFQQFNLFPHLTVLENITTSPRSLLGKSKKDAEKRAMELLDMVELENKAHALPTELSGGQQQRVAIARALAMDPEVLLLDEPTSALDPTMVDEVLDVIVQLAKLGITLLIVTHEMRLAKSISTRIFYMDEGGIYEDGTPQQIFEAPQKLKTINFIGRVDMLNFHLKKNEVDFAHIRDSCLALVDKYNHDRENFRRHVLIVRNIVRSTLFPIAEDVDLYVGAQKDSNKLGVEVIWDGKHENPLSPETERLLDSEFDRHRFTIEADGRPCLRFMFH